MEEPASLPEPLPLKRYRYNTKETVRAAKRQKREARAISWTRFRQILEDFKNSEDLEYTFDASLSRHERLKVHRLWAKMGMKSKSSGTGADRRLSLYKIKTQTQTKVKAKPKVKTQTKVKAKPKVKTKTKFKTKTKLKTKTRSENTEVKCPITSFTFSEEGKKILRDLFSLYPPGNNEAEKIAATSGKKTHNKSMRTDDFFCKPPFRKADIVNKHKSFVAKTQSNLKLKQITEFRSKLPIASFKDVITSTIESNQVVLISGETGCGKTTQVPQYLLDYMWGKGEACKIVCTQPRRISAVSVSERIAIERGEHIGKNVGYKIRMETKGGQNSSIVFCTNGVLLRILIKGGKATSGKQNPTERVNDTFRDITHIIVDEIHERDRFSDFMLTIVRDMLPLYPHLRLVLMSATLDAERFSQYFGGCPIIRVPGFTYDVKKLYLEDVLLLVESESISARRLDCSSATTLDQTEEKRLLNRYLKIVDPELVDIVLIEKLLRKICIESKEGAILVFLPGWDEINRLQTKLCKDKFFQNTHKFLVLVLHSMVPSIEQKKVFQRPPCGCRKIVLSTNVAETSVTIDDVVFVIDSGRAKEKSYDQYNKVSTLQTSWISKANAKQREGRAGRCQPGICYHLYSKLCASTLMEFQEPEIKRTPIEELCLQVKLLDPSNKIEDFLKKTLDPPVSLAIDNAITVLQDLGALTPDEELTELGEKLGLIRAHPITSKMLLFAISMKCLDPALTLACANNYRDPFTFSMLPEEKEKAKDAKSRLASLYGGHGDQLAIIAAFEGWKFAKQTSQQTTFCSQYFVSTAVMKMLSKMREQLQLELRMNGFIPEDPSILNENSQNGAIINAVLVAGLYPKVGRMLSRSIIQDATNQKIRLTGHSVNSRLKLTKKDVPLVIYDEVTRGDMGLNIKKCSIIGPLPLLLLATEIAVAPINDDNETIYEEGHNGRPNDEFMSNSDTVVQVIADRWLSFKLTALDAAHICCLRETLSAAILFKITHPGKDLPQVLAASVAAIAKVLSCDGTSGILRRLNQLT